MSDDDIDNMDFALPQDLLPVAQPKMLHQLPPESKTWTCIYPIYISTHKARKVPRKLAVKEPAAIYISEALKRLGFNAILEPMKRHPSDPLVFGRLRVPLQGHAFTKRQLLIEVAKMYDQVVESTPDHDGRIKQMADQSRSVLVWPEEPVQQIQPKAIKPSKKKK